MAPSQDPRDMIFKDVIHLLPERVPLAPKMVVMKFSGTPKQVLTAEEILIGLMAKPSGIASMATRFVRSEGDKTTIVAGAWEKMPPSLNLSSAVRWLSGVRNHAS